MNPWDMGLEGRYKRADRSLYAMSSAVGRAIPTDVHVRYLTRRRLNIGDGTLKVALAMPRNKSMDISALTGLSNG